MSKRAQIVGTGGNRPLRCWRKGKYSSVTATAVADI